VVGERTHLTATAIWGARRRFPKRNVNLSLKKQGSFPSITQARIRRKKGENPEQWADIERINIKRKKGKSVSKKKKGTGERPENRC